MLVFSTWSTNLVPNFVYKLNLTQFKFSLDDSKGECKDIECK